MARKVKAEDPPPYLVAVTEQEERAVIDRALQILRDRNAPGATIAGPRDAMDYLTLRLSENQAETFGVVWLSTRHTVLAVEDLSVGTLDSATVYPREVVKAGLRWNAGAAMLYHNHPSGCAEPSTADRHLTDQLVAALKLVGIRVLDHFVVASGGAVSFAERGWI